jgi:ornithine carbamoyltransferase
MPTLTIRRHVLRVADLPAHRGKEVDAAVIDGPQSAVWQQAADRLATEQALIYALITGDWDASA